MTNIAIFSLILYSLFLIFSKIFARIMTKGSHIIANNCEHIERDENKTETNSNKKTLKINTPIAILICLIPVLNILFDIFILIMFFSQVIMLIAMKNTINGL